MIKQQHNNNKSLIPLSDHNDYTNYQLQKRLKIKNKKRPKLLYASAYVGFAMIAFSIILAAASILPWRKKEENQ